MPKWAQEDSEKYLIPTSWWFVSFFPCHVNYDLKLQPHCSTQLFELFYQADAALSAVYSNFHGQHIAHYLVTCSGISDSYIKGMISASYLRFKFSFSRLHTSVASCGGKGCAKVLNGYPFLNMSTHVCPSFPSNSQRVDATTFMSVFLSNKENMALFVNSNNLCRLLVVVLLCLVMGKRSVHMFHHFSLCVVLAEGAYKRLMKNRYCSVLWMS